MQSVDHTRNFNTAKSLNSLYRLILSLNCLYLVLGDLFGQHLRSGVGGGVQLLYVGFRSPSSSVPSRFSSCLLNSI